MKRITAWLSQFDWGALIGSALFFVFFAFVFLPVIIGVCDYEAAKYQAAQSAPQISAQDAAAGTVAYYTKVLAWFTAVLSVVSAIQLWFLRRSDETARILLTPQENPPTPRLPWNCPFFAQSLLKTSSALTNPRQRWAHTEGW